MLTVVRSAVIGLAGVLFSGQSSGEFCCDAPVEKCRTASALLDRATRDGELPMAGKNTIHKVDCENY